MKVKRCFLNLKAAPTKHCSLVLTQRVNKALEHLGAFCSQFASHFAF
jgi:hypothetical protein